MDPADLDLFERSLRQATENHTGDELDQALANLGWHDALITDSGAAVSLLFELLGTENATSSALEHVLATAPGLAGAATGGLVLPPLGRFDPPGRVVGNRCAVRGLTIRGAQRRDGILIIAEIDAGHVAITADPGQLELRPIGGLDPDLGLAELTGDLRMPGRLSSDSTIDWAGAMARGQLALGHELVGAARAMLELARQHALHRIQFGRPIGSFQAVRHRLADSLVAIEAADALLAAAWEDGTPVAASIAKAFAGRGARAVAGHCQQVLAGIGFTTEHRLHRFVRRTILLDQLLGAGSTLSRQLGANVLGDGRLPPLFPL
jgi:acyl-CoA dehydrogenase-like protein